MGLVPPPQFQNKHGDEKTFYNMIFENFVLTKNTWKKNGDNATFPQSSGASLLSISCRPTSKSCTSSCSSVNIENKHSIVWKGYHLKLSQQLKHGII